MTTAEQTEKSQKPRTSHSIVQELIVPEIDPSFFLSHLLFFLSLIFHLHDEIAPRPRARARARSDPIIHARRVRRTSSLLFSLAKRRDSSRHRQTRFVRLQFVKSTKPLVRRNQVNVYFARVLLNRHVYVHMRIPPVRS